MKNASSRPVFCMFVFFKCNAMLPHDMLITVSHDIIVQPRLQSTQRVTVESYGPASLLS